VSETNKLFEAVKALPPEQKVRLFGFLGMHRIGGDHDPACPADRTFSCNCVPPESTWTHPQGVDVYLEDTWEDRLKVAQQRIKTWKARGM
jgi:hypothetical protein